MFRSSSFSRQVVPQGDEEEGSSTGSMSTVWPVANSIGCGASEPFWLAWLACKGSQKEPTAMGQIPF